MSRFIWATATLQQVGDDWRVLGPGQYSTGFQDEAEALRFLDRDGWVAAVVFPGLDNGFKVFARRVDVELFADLRRAIEREQAAKGQHDEARRRMREVTEGAAVPWSDDVTSRHIAHSQLVETLAKNLELARADVENARARLYGRESKAA